MGASSDLAITSRIADSETACIVSRGCAKLNKNFAGSAIFHTTEKSMSTMFSSPKAILENGRLCLITKCNEEWCKIKTDKYLGWVKKQSLWGNIN